MSYSIRPYQSGDLDTLYDVCLRTGANGQDASPLYQDGRLLGHFYAAPYTSFERDLCWVVVHSEEVCGYILGTSDSPAFGRWMESVWLPPLRQHYPLPDSTNRSADADVIRTLHGGYFQHPDTYAYPAHFHIDLLPHAQGRGLGRTLVNQFFDAVRAKGVAGVHVGVSEGNRGGITFYERIGFRLLGSYPGWSTYGFALKK